MSAIPEGADYRISGFNKQGVKKVEFDASFHCIWTMAPTIGTASFILATNDAKCLYENIQFGNYILFEHAHLGNWAGVICPHNRRVWNGKKQVTIPIMAAEYQFHRRRAQAGLRIDGTAGAVFRQLCQQANGPEDALIRVDDGSIWTGGNKCGIEDPKNALMDDVMSDLVAKTGVDWWFDPQVNEQGRLVFNAYLAPHRGTTTNYVLKEGFNIETPDGDFYAEEGDLENDVLTTGSAQQASGSAKGLSRDTDSINSYGLWQASKSVSDTTAGPTQAAAEGGTESGSQPIQKIMLTALESDESPDTFAHINMGDVDTVDLYSVGFYANSNGVDAQARILSREYETNENKCVLVNQVVLI